MYFSSMEIQWLTQQFSSICTPEPRFNLSAQKTTVSRNLTGLGLGFCSASQTKFLPNLSLLSVSTESIFSKKLFIFYFASVFAEQLATDLWCSNSFSGLSNEIYRPVPRSCIGTPVFSGQAQLLTSSDQSVISG